MQLIENKFICGGPVMPEKFLGRERQLHQCFGRLATGQSVAVIGQPHIGKTSFLNYMLDERVRRNYCANKLEHSLFSFMDAQMLKNIDARVHFWKEALAPLTIELLKGTKWIKKLTPVFKAVQKNDFENFVLKQLFKELSQTGACLILVLDEFDVFLSHPRLHSSDFYGGLRSMASTTGGLILVIASRRKLHQLAAMTTNLNPSGSPYFNIFLEIRLGAFLENNIKDLLDRTGYSYNSKDRGFINDISGRHPYLAQLAASQLLEARSDNLNETESYMSTVRELHKHARSHFIDTWQNWSPETRKVIFALTLVDIGRLLEDKQLRVHELIDSLSNYSPELEELEEIGTVAKINANEWKINQFAFLRWLADDLCHNIRNETDIKTWLNKQEIDSILTNRERENMISCASKVLSKCENASTTLMENFVYRYKLPKPIPPRPPKIRILFLAADPTDTARIRLGKEFDEIQEKLKLSKYGHRFRLEIPKLSLRREDITQALFDKEPHILHFSGHGSARGALCFEDEIGMAHLVEPQALADLLKKSADHIECVILNACNTARHAKKIAKHIDYAIGMRKPISDPAAIAFSVGFYQALGAGKKIEEAFEYGKDQIGLLNLSEKQIPVLEKNK